MEKTANPRVLPAATKGAINMGSMSSKRVVLVTCASADEADRIAQAVVEKRLAACVNRLEAPVRSTYWWKGNLATSAEYLLLMKTEERLLGELQAEVERLHSYEVPEFIALPIASGAEKYLEWLASSVRPAAKPKRTSPRKRK
jgi:periplasmic divalent cation tolerance protein